MAKPGNVTLALTLIIASNFFYGLGENIANAYLPQLAKTGSIGRLSSFGFSLGYLGGLLALGLALWYVSHAQAAQQAANSFVPVTVLIASAIYAIASLPALFILRERPPPNSNTHQVNSSSIYTTFIQLRRTLMQLRDLPDLAKLYWAAAFYQSGVAVVITVAAIYAQQAMGFTQQESIMLILLVNITAAIGAFGFGFLQDRIGAKTTLLITLAGWLLMVALMLLTESRNAFWLAANIAGLCLGSSQSVGRALAGQLAPRDRCAEFYGMWGFFVRLAGIAGPLFYGLIHYFAGNNHRAAMLGTGLFFVAGILLVSRIDIARGIKCVEPH